VTGLLPVITGYIWILFVCVFWFPLCSLCVCRYFWNGVCIPIMFSFYTVNI
jgi:hypothetical protein